MSTKDPDRLTTPPDGAPEESQPRWRRDFPIDWPQDRYISQRDFIKFLLLVSLGFVSGQFWLVWKSLGRGLREARPRMEIAGAGGLAVGASMVFHYPDRDTPCLLIRMAEDRYLAYGQQCTHLLCPVIPNVAEGRLDCPCHEGRFDLVTGRPIAGPPRRPLPRIRIEVRDGRIWAVGKEDAA
jgi:nitrite reductase/ring-hydroxylating ferredoxin subunit